MDYMVTGCCMFCGQERTLPGNEPMTGDSANEYITAHCHCEGAMQLRRQNENQENLQTLFGPDAGDEGFAPASDETYAALEDLLGAVEQGALLGASVTLPNGDVARFRQSGYRVAITRVSRRQASM